jgi:hypothetical protein
VGVNIDEAGRDDQTFRVDDSRATFRIEFADLCNYPVLNGDVGFKPGIPGAIDYSPAGNDQIEIGGRSGDDPITRRNNKHDSLRTQQQNLIRHIFFRSDQEVGGN